MIIMDLGSGASPLGGILSVLPQVKKSFSIDLSDAKFSVVRKLYGPEGAGLKWPFDHSLKQMSNQSIAFPKWELRYQDWFEAIEEFEDSSIDVAVDSCATHLFIKKSGL